ncbi:hypothetical protein C2857_006485 [Epichloe festucae Fl1]|uniref:GH16 domain-containing protein n=1 Tax=Epichloe festucae (strain Fl1) TaxID=877507 RepID=A0A7S9KTI8_EPIFF|nr:hypothetical protein C2857_006485 [Epichloe festucae Fl1]
MHHRQFVFLTTSLSLNTVALAAATPISDPRCTCYLTNGTEPTFYKTHRFFDFRNLTQFASRSIPEIISSPEDTSSAPPTSSFFTSPLWTSTWQAQSWNNSKSGTLNGDATILMINSPNNIYIQPDNGSSSSDSPPKTHLAMRTSRQPTFQTSSEFQALSSTYHYLSLRTLARTTGSPGAVSAVFTYRDAKSPADIQEADMEMLTRGPRNKVQYTNQPSYTTGGGQGQGGDANLRATRNATLPYAKEWTDWAVHRLDWTPMRSTWYVDGQQVASIAFQVPRDPAGINFNAWSDGGSWSGNMSIGSEATLQIQWIEMLYNTTEKTTTRRDGTGAQLDPRDSAAVNKEECRVVCSIDEASETRGAAVKLWGDDESQAGVLVSAVTCALLARLGVLWVLVMTL